MGAACFAIHVKENGSSGRLLALTSATGNGVSQVWSTPSTPLFNPPLAPLLNPASQPPATDATGSDFSRPDKDGAAIINCVVLTSDFASSKFAVTVAYDWIPVVPEKGCFGGGGFMKEQPGPTQGAVDKCGAPPILAFPHKSLAGMLL